jgi:hypothetical protein
MTTSTDPGSTWSLRALLDPVPEPIFFRDHFEKEPLHVQRARPDYFSDLVSLDDIDRIVTTCDFYHPNVMLAREGATIGREEFSGGDGKLDVASLLALHADGATLVLNQLEDMIAPVSALCGALELEFSALFQSEAESRLYAWTTPAR